jgi:Zn-finger nucleic acid-binding protein
MDCPRCKLATMEERDRQGIVIDVCEQCRGIWLDRGELEKLITRATREMEGLDSDRGHGKAPDSDRYGRSHKKRSWLDIFD